MGKVKMAWFLQYIKLSNSLVVAMDEEKIRPWLNIALPKIQ